MSNSIRICTSSLGRKYIMALTGLLLGGFLLVHAAGNSTIFHGNEAFNAYAEHLRSLHLLLPIAGILLLAVFLLHILTGFSLMLGNWKAKSRKYAVCRSAVGLRGLPARIMPYTGTAVLAFLLLHLDTVRFADQAVSVADRVSRVLQDPLLALLYAAGIAALGLHIKHGFWSLTQSLGINHPLWNRLIRGITCLISILIVSIFTGIIISFGLN
ncbi:succinate dehydrogenase cytochrome b subunit [Desulfobulbus sp. F3]|nr:succinate dehydrogenase cytochrome b subunit [Desulfobulbus sp. F3]